MLDNGTYRHLILPVIAEEDQIILIGRGKTVHRHPGILLFPEPLDRETLDWMLREMESSVYSWQQ